MSTISINQFSPYGEFYCVDSAVSGAVIKDPCNFWTKLIRNDKYGILFTIA